MPYLLHFFKKAKISCQKKYFGGIDTKKSLVILSAAIIAAGCFTGCGKTVETDTEATELSNKISYENVTEENGEALTSQAVENGNMNEKASSDTRAPSSPENKSEDNPSLVVAYTSSGTEKKSYNSSEKSNTTQKETQVQTTVFFTPESVLVNEFVITKVSGTYLEMYAVDDEHEYCCNLSNIMSSADMNYKVGDTVTLRYDANVAETCPLQITVIAIL